MHYHTIVYSCTIVQLYIHALSYNYTVMHYRTIIYSCTTVQLYIHALPYNYMCMHHYTIICLYIGVHTCLYNHKGPSYIYIYVANVALRSVYYNYRCKSNLSSHENKLRKYVYHHQTRRTDRRFERGWRR